MSKLYEKLNRESEHIVLTAQEKAAMRAAIFGAPSPLSVARPAKSPYLFFSSGLMRALAALVIVVGAGTGTAFASQGALPGQPLYAVKTKVVEPMELALATTPVAKATVHAQIAQERVAEAEALAQQGALDATTSAELADNFEAHAQSAVALADEASSSDPAAAVQIKAQLAVNSSVGGAVLAALGERGRDGDHAAVLAARVLAMADRGDNGEDHQTMSASVRTLATAAPAAKATVRTMAVMSATDTGSGEGDGSHEGFAPPAATTVTAAANPAEQKAAVGLQSKAQDALSALKQQFAAASSTLDATTTVSIQNSLSGIDALLSDGTQALNDSIFDTAVQDYTQALARSLRLSALLEAQRKFDNHLIEPLIKDDSGSSDSGSVDTNPGSSDHSGDVRTEVNL